MRLFLIRHGETVDNVARVYAGLRDSALTAHGVLQTRRLASHLAERAPGKVRIFSSDLQRAAQTAEAIREAKAGIPDLQQLVALREKDFGTGEGLRYGTGKDQPHQDSESAESMRARVDAFLEGHLLPTLKPNLNDSLIIVAHGIILNVLFTRLCDRLSRSGLTISPEAQHLIKDFPKGNTPALPSWSNTGYLEGELAPKTAGSWESLRFHLVQVNCVDHLEGLHKTRGGIGSARFDRTQRTMDSFLAPQKRKRSDVVQDE